MFRIRRREKPGKLANTSFNSVSATAGLKLATNKVEQGCADDKVVVPLVAAAADAERAAATICGLVENTEDNPW